MEMLVEIGWRTAIALVALIFSVVMIVVLAYRDASERDDFWDTSEEAYRREWERRNDV